eukprot:525448-Lingulodinium_polyedra.AAC.1
MGWRGAAGGALRWGSRAGAFARASVSIAGRAPGPQSPGIWSGAVSLQAATPAFPGKPRGLGNRGVHHLRGGHRTPLA